MSKLFGGGKPKKTNEELVRTYSYNNTSLDLYKFIYIDFVGERMERAAEAAAT
jgi:hypothetical protein